MEESYLVVSVGAIGAEEIQWWTTREIEYDSVVEMVARQFQLPIVLGGPRRWPLEHR